MLQTDQKLNICSSLNWEMLAPKERIVFLDIETTGFKASSSSLYLIGLAEFRDDSWRLRQFFAQSRADEIELIRELNRFFREKRKGQDHLILVTYNGNGFDIPYLKEVEKEYGENGLFKDIISLDLYKEIKPFKKIAGLENLQLKTVEKKCGICREDIYSGGDLIPVYEEYLRLCRVIKGGCEDNERNDQLKKKCLDCLLLHNAEDIADMIPVMQMMGYRHLYNGCFDFEKAEVTEIGGKKVLDLCYRLKEHLPAELYSENENTVISVSGEDPYRMEIAVSLESGERRYYYADYREYYFLPAEDMAVHKSVAEFVDRKNRVKATASNCYTKEKGEFFAVPGNAGRLAPFFYRTYKGTPYAKFKEELLTEEPTWKEYAMALLESLSG